MDYGSVGIQPVEREAPDVGGDVARGWEGGGMFGEGETLGDEVVIYD